MTTSAPAVGKPHRRTAAIRTALIVLVLAALVSLVLSVWPTIGLFLTNQGQIKFDEPGVYTVTGDRIGSTTKTHKGGTTLNLPEGYYNLSCGGGGGLTIMSPADLQGPADVTYFPVERGSSTTFACVSSGH